MTRIHGVPRPAVGVAITGVQMSQAGTDALSVPKQEMQRLNMCHFSAQPTQMLSS